MAKPESSFTGQRFATTAYVDGVLKILPGTKGDEYYVALINLLEILDGYKGKHIRVTIQEVTMVVTK